MKEEVRRREQSGFVTFNKNSRRYFFENLKPKEIKKIYQDGFELPLRVQWRITKLCNLKCKHCYLNKKNFKKEELSKKGLIKNS
jgi:sulfatase maturation enzyme AslB (radical SAM superfamily)